MWTFVKFSFGLIGNFLLVKFFLTHGFQAFDLSMNESAYLIINSVSGLAGIQGAAACITQS